MRRAILVLLLATSPAFGMARHVYLNESGGGSQLDDCSNPTHNIKGTSNTDELSYCAGAALNNALNRLICDAGAGCKAWTTTTGICESPANLGTVTPVTNGTTINTFSGAGTTNTVIYGHPQACVWNMNPSDSCEVHAGTYKRGGTISDWDASGSTNTVDRSDCWIASITALGHGSNPAIGTDCPTTPTPTQVCGYGSLNAPAYVRGAEMDANADGDVLDSHEIDTWDENNNKIADSTESLTSYPVILSGDADLDGVLREATSCSADAAVNGDAFYLLLWGCGGGDGGSTEVCKTNIAGGFTRPFIDTNADGTFDTMLPGGPRDVSHFVIKNIEGTDYGGGPTSMSGNGVREHNGHLSIGGEGDSGGFVADHIYFHGSGYANVTTNEHYCGIFGDDNNGDCHKDHEIKNSHFVLDNRTVINDDGDSWDACGNQGSGEAGCGWYFHDNKVVVASNPGCSGSGCRKSLVRFKSVDTLQNGLRKKQFRLANNDITWEATTGEGGWPWFIHTECIGTCGDIDRDRWCNNPSSVFGLGEFWFYGNVFHFRSGAVGATPFGGFGCTSDGSPDNHSYRLYVFNNTWDGARTGAEASNTFGGFCTSTAELSVSRNNALYRASSVNQTTADTTRYTTATNRCSESSQTGCTTPATNTRTGSPNGWWTAGTWGVAANATLANYIPRPLGPLDETGSCDPDGDGIAGVDYDNNPATGASGQETTWTDIAGNTVDCSGSNVMDIGAIQSSNDVAPGAVCGNGVTEVGETCDDGTQPVNACTYGDSPPLQQVCNATCDGNTNCDQPQYCGDSSVQTAFEQCDGVLLNGHNCAEFGCTLGTPTCVACTISSAGCTQCAALNPDLIGVDIHGVSINP